MSQDMAQPSGKKNKLHAFKPFLIALGIVIVVCAIKFGRDYHIRASARTRVTFLVLADGRQVEHFPIIKLDGLPFRTGENVTLGLKKLRIDMPDKEPFEKNFFAWYGNNDLGEFKLVHSKGKLELAVQPMPEKIDISGIYFDLVM